MSVDYKKYQLVQDMKTCQAYMRKIASGLLERSKSHIDHRANQLEASARIIGEWIKGIEDEK